MLKYISQDLTLLAADFIHGILFSYRQYHQL